MAAWQGKEPIPVWIERMVRERATLAQPPGVVHKRQIAVWKSLAYVDCMNGDVGFRLELLRLFLNWSECAAERFVRQRSLPQGALRDLRWSRDLWLPTMLGMPKLVLSARSHPGIPWGADVDYLERAGYTVRSPHDASPPDLKRGARRLYQHVILRHSYNKIARAEKGALRTTDTKAVRAQVKRYAAELGIVLARRGPGRPKRANLPRVAPRMS